MDPANEFFAHLPARVLDGFQFEATRYAMGTLSVFVLVWLLFAPLLRSRKIRNTPHRARQIRDELRNSAITILVFVALDVLIFDLGDRGLFRKYDEIGQFGWLWFFVSIPVALVLHDAWFYWTHRLMHTKRFYRAFHLTHHRSHNPTPFTAYSFAPGEAVVNYMFIPALLILLPIHSFALYTVMTIMIFKNATAHCGYELFPRNWVFHPLLGCLTTVTHHDMHHARATGNYGFYFTWWDRWMGTEHADYLDQIGRRLAADLDQRALKAAAGRDAAAPKQEAAA
ncbi:MAG: sterol desaturase family protein [Hyphomonas sp.]|nr:sterol desaturase family protein [Hyphomonas sp.]